MRATSEAAIRRQEIGRRVVYLLVAAAVITPFIKPLPMEFKASQLARDLYDRVEALAPGSPVLLAFDYDPSSMAELDPMATALLRHCFALDLHPIVMTQWPSGVGLAEEHCRTTAEEAGKQSGEDYVFLGFKPGGENLLLNMGESLQGAFDKDYYKQPTEGMPALEGVRSLKDIPLAIDIAAGNTIETWIAYGSDRFGFDLGAGCTAVMAPDLYPFLQSKQLIGFLGGLRGAADYEVLLETPGTASKGMQAQSLTHVLIIVLILGANVLFVWRRLRGVKEPA